MTEEEIQQELNESGNFLRRQRLLKELWKIRRLREQATTDRADRRQSPSPSTKPPAFNDADALVA